MIEKRDRRNLILILLAIVGTVCVLRACGVLGVRSGKVAQTAQKSMQISRSWDCAQNWTPRLSVGVFYDYDVAPLKGTYYCYVNRPGFSFGYFAQSRGKITQDDGIVRVDCGAYGTAYFSLNAQEAVKVIRDDGVKPKTQKIPQYHPFALTSLKRDCRFRFYDAGGKELSVSDLKK